MPHIMVESIWYLSWMIVSFLVLLYRSDSYLWLKTRPHEFWAFQEIPGYEDLTSWFDEDLVCILGMYDAVMSVKSSSSYIISPQLL